MKEGEELPEDFLYSHISQRLAESDCQINGWILEGYPTQKSHIAQLKSMGYHPSHVLSLEIPDSKIYERLEHRRFDPLQGIYYNTSTNPPTDAEVIERLIQSPEDKHPVVKKRLERHK